MPLYCFINICLFLFQLPGKKGEGSKGWMMHGQMTLSVWLGLHKHKKNFLDDIPKGFDVVMIILFLSLITIWPWICCLLAVIHLSP